MAPARSDLIRYFLSNKLRKCPLNRTMMNMASADAKEATKRIASGVMWIKVNLNAVAAVDQNITAIKASDLLLKYGING